MFSGWLFAKQKEDLVTESLTLGQSSDRPDSKKKAPAASSIGLLLSLQFRNARSTLRAVVASSNQSISNVALGAFFGAGAALSAAALSAATLPAAALGSPAPASTSNAPVSTSNDD